MVDTVAVIVSIVSILITVFGGVFMFGKLANRLDNIEERQREDRESNKDQHKDFYSTKDTVIEISTNMKNIDSRLSSVELGIGELLNRIPAIK